MNRAADMDPDFMLNTVTGDEMSLSLPLLYDVEWRRPEDPS